MKLSFKPLYFVMILFIFIQVKCEDDSELTINILPSEKYKLNKRDLLNLKTDIERQVKNIFYN